jgi:hypothetical protein
MNPEQNPDYLPDDLVWIRGRPELGRQIIAQVFWHQVKTLNGETVQEFFSYKIEGHSEAYKLKQYGEHCLCKNLGECIQDELSLPSNPAVDDIF